MNKKRTMTTVAGSGLILLTSVLPVAADENTTLHGKTIGELSAGWWQWQEANYPGFTFGEGQGRGQVSHRCIFSVPGSAVGITNA